MLCSNIMFIVLFLQGQEIVAENALSVAAKEGHWVILQVRTYIYYKICIYIARKKLKNSTVSNVNLKAFL